MNLLLTIFWILAAAVFCGWIYLTMGADRAYTFASAYLIEKSLSVDNLFVFSLIFTTFKVDPKMQRSLLNWGIIGAVILRGTLILAGTALVGSFHWVLYIFGAFLVYTAIKLLKGGDDGGLDSRLIRFFDGLGLSRFLTVLLIIEFSDVIFALDSIPATLAITQDTFIVFTSNMFAILGLRALYFVLVDMLDRFEYLKYGVSLVLLFIGLKILAAHWIPISTGLSLMVTAAILGISVIVSIVKTRGENHVQGICENP